MCDTKEPHPNVEFKGQNFHSKRNNNHVSSEIRIYFIKWNNIFLIYFNNFITNFENKIQQKMEWNNIK